MNREEHLQKTFPLEDGTTYIQSIDAFNEPKGAGVGAEVEKGNFIDSISNEKKSRLNQLEGRKYGDNEIVHGVKRKNLFDFMWNWIREKSGK